jgi:hypothetical protein
MRVFSDTTTIRSHVLVGGFVENYMISTYHGEKIVPPPTENTLNKMIEDVEKATCKFWILWVLHVRICGCKGDTN